MSIDPPTQRPLSRSFLWFILRIPQGNPQKELLKGLWVSTPQALKVEDVGWGEKLLAETLH